MKIGLLDIDSKIPNLALMKISQWHKQQGDEVEHYMPLAHHLYDKIYASKIFNFSDGSDTAWIYYARSENNVLTFLLSVHLVQCM